MLNAEIFKTIRDLSQKSLKAEELLIRLMYWCQGQKRLSDFYGFLHTVKNWELEAEWLVNFFVKQCDRDFSKMADFLKICDNDFSDDDEITKTLLSIINGEQPADLDYIRFYLDCYEDPGPEFMDYEP